VDIVYYSKAIICQKGRRGDKDWAIFNQFSRFRLKIIVIQFVMLSVYVNILRMAFPNAANKTNTIKMLEIFFPIDCRWREAEWENNFFWNIDKGRKCQFWNRYSELDGSFILTKYLPLDNIQFISIFLWNQY
jgi:hypothetical protein